MYVCMYACVRYQQVKYLVRARSKGYVTISAVAPAIPLAIRLPTTTWKLYSAEIHHKKKSNNNFIKTKNYSS